MNTPEIYQQHLKSILQHLKKFGQLTDAEIAAGTKIPLTAVRACIPELGASQEISHCSVIRFEGTKEIKSTLCRISGYTPPKAPGRKPGS